ncbi:MAG: hypothetical protein E2O84_05435 [Bacteroidetes bacterium]|nr:MAG: hypothetical protein E2O84_05435 [Bacteroidota bacterium]
MHTQKQEKSVTPSISTKALQAELSNLHHRMNNPLAVISGNVQLLKELAKALSVGEDLEGPLTDIASAVDQLAAGTEQLILLRELLQRTSE